MKSLSVSPWEPCQPCQPCQLCLCHRKRPIHIWKSTLNWLVLGSFLAVAAYYGVYEYIHWCMHLPKKRNVERSWIFYRLNGHHLLHHRYMHKNFNVVLPLADLLTGTLMLRSKVCFAQALGPRVPNVQPRNHPTRQDRVVSG